MIRSMTAFARKDEVFPWGSLVWEVRCVNHRYLEISPRAPEDLRVLEPKIRELVAKYLKRGKTDCTCRLKLNAESQQHTIDRAFTESLLSTCNEVQAMLPAGAAPLSALEVLKWPGVLQVPETDWKSIQDTALNMLEFSLQELVVNRQREGEKLAEFIELRTQDIDKIVQEVRQIYPDIVALQRQRVLKKVQDLDVDLDPDRLEQEVAMLAQKMDVAEELDRLELHNNEVKRLLSSDQPVGRRLDFLMQELNREANTLGSKSVHAETTRASVDLKVLIEQIREQVQNIE